MSRGSRGHQNVGVSPMKVLYVAGMPRSGSTLFDLMAGQLPGHCDVGELFYLWPGILRNQLCACGRPFADCPFWHSVGQSAFGGWDRVDTQEVLALQRQVDTTSRLPLAQLGRLLPSHAAAVKRYLDLTTRVYGGAACAVGADVVVDSSKRPSTAFLLAGAPNVDVRVTHLIRDPRGVVNSWNRDVPLPKGSGAQSHLKRRPTRQIVRRWITVNLMIEALSSKGVPTARVRYEDLVANPVDTMGDVLRLFGKQPSPADTSFLGPDGLETGSSHAIAGGRVRMRTGTVPLRLDEAWRRELPRWKSRVTTVATSALMRRYGYR